MKHTPLATKEDITVNLPDFCYKFIHLKSFDDNKDTYDNDICILKDYTIIVPNNVFVEIHHTTLSFCYSQRQLDNQQNEIIIHNLTLFFHIKKQTKLDVIRRNLLSDRDYDIDLDNTLTYLLLTSLYMDLNNNNKFPIVKYKHVFFEQSNYIFNLPNKKSIKNSISKELENYITNIFDRIYVYNCLSIKMYKTDLPPFYPID